MAEKIYNEKICAAELAVIDHSYDQAGTLYEEAFKLNPKPLVNDLYNALMVAIAQQNAKEAFAYASNLASLGVGASFFERKAAFFWLKKMSAWPKLVKQAKAGKKYVNLQSELNALAQEHQRIIDKSYQNVSSDTLNVLSTKKKEIEQKLQVLFDKNGGYLSEYEIGVNIKDDTVIVPPIFTDILKMRYVDLSSHQVYYMSQDSIAQMLMQAEREGKVSFEFMAGNLTNASIDSAAVKSVLLSGCNFYLCLLPGQTESAINDRRKALGLCSVGEYLKKIHFNVSNPHSPFKIGPDLASYFSSDYQDVNSQLVRNCIFIEKRPDCK
ncbi:hypothetical protein [Taibaiella koreensis]|uniref:hypothetical protein n=1 Tax=Taibaiella koreensis TaxID=1268548 RepID=UPI0013C2D874|nr:hypothetical protein [Taibaiella koreensis]